jgi:RNA polymerase sigma-70 factor (ECF subfamily)
LFTVARNQARRTGRRQAWLVFFGLGSPSAEAVPDIQWTENAVEAEQVRTIVSAALSRLAPHFREALVLRFVEGLRYDEIAAIIDRTPSAARSRVHYGLKAIAHLLPVGLKP